MNTIRAILEQHAAACRDATGGGKWLELFAREERDGWLSWGNEVSS